jgi:hypothetical protein
MNAAYAQRAKEYVLWEIHGNRAFSMMLAVILGFLIGGFGSLLLSSPWFLVTGFLPVGGVWYTFPLFDTAAVTTAPHKKHQYITLVHLPNGMTYYVVHYEGIGDPAEVFRATTYDPSLP